MNMKKKNSIKRAQSQAGLSFAERKNFRPMAKILTLLVLLMTAVSGAWAQEGTLLTTIENTGDNVNFISGSQTFDNIATVTFSDVVLNVGDNWGWYSMEERTLTVTAAEGYTITRVKFYNNSGSAFDEEAPFEAILAFDGDPFTGDPFTKVNGTSIGAAGVNKIEVYGYADTPEPAAEPVTVYFTDAKGWGDVKVYYWPNGTEWPGNAMTYVEDNEYNQKVYKAQVPANVEGIIFNGNGKQTVNITENIANNAWWYSDAEGGDGKFTVGYVGKYLAVEPTQNPNEWAFAMPAYDMELEMEYYPLATLATLPAAAEGLNDATTADLLTPGTSTEGTLYYALGNSEAPTGQWSTDIPTTEGLEAGQYYVWYKVVGDAEHSDSQPQSIAVTVAALPAYAVTIDDAGVDVSNWQATPAEQRAGQTVTLSYGGKKKIRSITIEKAAEAKPAATVTTAPTAKTGVKAGQNEAIVNAGTTEGGTMMYMVNATQPASTDGFSATVPTAEGLTAGTYYVWYYVKADDSHTDSEISATGIEVTIDAAETTVTWTTAQMNDEFMVYDSFVNNNSHYGITVTASGSGSWEANNIMVDGPMTFTFTSTVGNIKSIVITAESINDMDEAPTGWTINGPWDTPRTLSWNGTASTTVDLPLSVNQNFSEISTIVFTLE